MEREGDDIRRALQGSEEAHDRGSE